MQDSLSDSTHRTRPLAKRATLALLTFFCVLSYQNCGSDFTPRTLDSLSVYGALCESALSATFESSFKPILTHNCQACHVPGGAGKGAFASDDTAIAFQDFVFATADKVSTNALNPSHAPGISGPGLQDSITTAKSQWDQAVEACKSGGSVGGSGSSSGDVIATTPKLMQATGQNKTLTWDVDTELSNPDGSNVSSGGAKFSVTVKAETNPLGTKIYYISNPTLSTGTAAIHVSAIRVRINNTDISVGTTYSRLEADVPANTKQSLSSATMVFEFPVADTDQLSVTFGDFETK